MHQNFRVCYVTLLFIGMAFLSRQVFTGICQSFGPILCDGYGPVLVLCPVLCHGYAPALVWSLFLCHGDAPALGFVPFCATAMRQHSVLSLFVPRRCASTRLVPVCATAMRHHSGFAVAPQGGPVPCLVVRCAARLGVRSRRSSERLHAHDIRVAFSSSWHTAACVSVRVPQHAEVSLSRLLSEAQSNQQQRRALQHHQTISEKSFARHISWIDQSTKQTDKIE